jgi:hypothetical protein
LTAGTVTFQTSVNSDQVNTTTITSPTVNCVNPTPTNTPIIPPTATYTSTSTAPTATQTIINTSPTPAPVSVQITGLLAYPNPLNPAIYSNLIFTFNVNQPANAIDEIGLRIYSSSYRLIREAVYSGADKDNILNSRRLIYASDNLIGLANGSYYYYIYAVQNGKETRSKINKLIIIK